MSDFLIIPNDENVHSHALGGVEHVSCCGRLGAMTTHLHSLSRLLSYLFAIITGEQREAQDGRAVRAVAVAATDKRPRRPPYRGEQGRKAAAYASIVSLTCI